MRRALVFAGTAEGREAAELMARLGIQVTACVATPYGGALMPPGVRVLTGRLDREGIAALIGEEAPDAVIDATHPYAGTVSANILDACGDTGARRVRVVRGASPAPGAEYFESVQEMARIASGCGEAVFSALGAKEAALLTAVDGYRERVWLRILPDAATLAECVGLGFAPARIICMQGPFPAGLNEAMFAHAGAGILLTKDGGEAGGFSSKLEAARSLGMRTFVLARPEETGGVSFETLKSMIEEGTI